MIIPNTQKTVKRKIIFIKSQHISGNALARASGDYQAQQQIGSTKGLLASNAYDTQGSLQDNRESNLLQRGLENQSRIGLNQTMGVGKEDLSGKAGIDAMNAIQYGTHAGVKSQIAQGNALRDTFGSDLSGGKAGISYDEAAYNNSLNQNMNLASSAEATKTTIKTGGFDAVYRAKKANATVAMASEVGAGRANEARLQREGLAGITQNTATLQDAKNIDMDTDANIKQQKFADVLGGNKNSKDSYQNTSYYNTSKKQEEMLGSASGIQKAYSGYDTFDKDGNKVHINGNENTFREIAEVGTTMQASAHNLKVQDVQSQNVQNALTTAKKNIESGMENLKKISEVEAFISGDHNKALRHRNQGEQQLIQEETTRFDNITTRENALNEHILTGASMQNLQYAQGSAEIAQAQASGFMQSSGNMTDAGTQAFNVMSAQRYGSMQNLSNTIGDSANQNAILSELKSQGVSQSDLNAISQAGNLGGRAGFMRELQSRFGKQDLRLQANGKSMSFSMGADGKGMSGSINEGLSYSYDDSRNFKFGTHADAGNVAYKAVDEISGGNVDAMRAAAYTGASIDMAMKASDVVLSFSGGGKVLKAGATVGRGAQWLGRKTMNGVNKVTGRGRSGELDSQEGIRSGEGRKTAVLEQLQNSGFKGKE